MKIFLASLFLSIFFQYASGQSFIKNYLFGNVYAESIPCSTGGYITLCHKDSIGNALIIKSNSEGDTLWSKSYFTPEGNSAAGEIIEKPEGGFYFIFNYQEPNFSNPRGRIASVDSIGNLIWYNDYDSVIFLKIYSNGSGVSILGVTVNPIPDLLALEIDSLGNTFLQNTFPFIANENINVFEKQNSNYYVTTGGADNNSFSKLYKLDLAGNTVWSFRVDSVKTVFTDIEALVDGSLFVALTKEDTVLHKQILHVYHLSSSGVLLWDKSYLDYANHKNANKIAFSDEGHLALTGTENDTGFYCCGNVYLLIIDSLGSELSHNQFTVTYEGYSINTTPDSGFIIVADDINPGPVQPGFYLIKTNKMGEIETGIQEVSSKAELKIFPNPASSTITLSLPSNQNTILSIFNLLGEKVKEEKVAGKQITLDVSSLPQRLYLVRMENRVVGKFVKE